MQLQMTILTISLTIILIIFLFSLINALNLKNKEKLFSFECGFNPIFSPQSPFSIQFFKIMLVFLVFDMEIIVILPVPFFLIHNMYLMITIISIMILILASLIFEWKEGTLQWLK